MIPHCILSQIVHQKEIHEGKLKDKKFVLLFLCNVSLIINLGWVVDGGRWNNIYEVAWSTFARYT
jgi:hypothetical protein